MKTFDFTLMLSQIVGLFGAGHDIRSRLIAYPARDWKVVVSCVAVGIVCAAGFGAFVFYQVTSAVTPKGDAQSAIAKSRLKPEDIESILTPYKQRVLLHELYLREGADGVVADPSR